MTLTNTLSPILTRLTGWRLNGVIIVFTVLLTDVVVALVDWALLSRVSLDSMKVSTVSGLIIATLVVSAAGALRARIAQRQQLTLEQVVERAQANMNVAVEAAQMLFWELDLVSGKFHFDHGRLAWLGMASDTQASTMAQWLALVHPDDRGVFIQRFEAAKPVGGPEFSFDYRIQQADGGWGWVQTQGRAKARNAQGEPIAAVGGTLNINQRKLAELALVDQNQFQNALMEAIPIPIFYKDAQGRYLGFNQAYEAFMGRSRTELIGKSVFDMASPELAEVYHAADLQLMAQRGTQVYESQVKDGAGAVHEVVFHKAAFLDSSGQVGGLVGGILDITARKQAQNQLQESERRTHALYTLLRCVADNVPDMIWAKDVDKRYLFVNKAICEQLLQAENTNEPLGKDDLFFAQRARSQHPDDAQWHTFGESCQDSDALTLQRGCTGQFDEAGHVQGHFLALDVHKAPLIDDTGCTIGVVGSARDVTAEHAAQEKLRIAALVLANSSEALMLSDAHGQIVDINPAFTQMTGYTRDEAVGKSTEFLRSDKHEAHFYQSKWTQIEAAGRWQGEVWNQRKNGEIFAAWLTINTLYQEDGSVHRRVGLFSDITDKKRADELIWTQANFDQLTSLPNRRMFQDRLVQDLKKAQRAGSRLALMFLDLDRFKQVNDTLGHAMGDLLLAEAARRIAACTREADTVARIGGDEFTVILAEMFDTSGIDRIANDMLDSLTQPFVLGTEQVQVSVSIGVALYPDDAQTQDELLNNADKAMYAAKEAGRNCFSYFAYAVQRVPAGAGRVNESAA